MKPDSVTAGGPSLRRYRLVSLWWLMNKFDGSLWVAYARILGQWGVDSRSEKAIVSSEEASIYVPMLRDLRAASLEHGLTASVATIDRMIGLLEKPAPPRSQSCPNWREI